MWLDDTVFPLPFSLFPTVFRTPICISLMAYLQPIYYLTTIIIISRIELHGQWPVIHLSVASAQIFNITVIRFSQLSVLTASSLWIFSRALSIRRRLLSFWRMIWYVFFISNVMFWATTKSLPQATEYCSHRQLSHPYASWRRSLLAYRRRRGILWSKMGQMLWAMPQVPSEIHHPENISIIIRQSNGKVPTWSKLHLHTFPTFRIQKVILWSSCSYWQRQHVWREAWWAPPEKLHISCW